MWRISDNVIIWFWETLEKFKEEEKALLLKFSTGTPCVPVGGFKALTVSITLFWIFRTIARAIYICTITELFSTLKLKVEKHLGLRSTIKLEL